MTISIVKKILTSFLAVVMCVCLTTAPVYGIPCTQAVRVHAPCTGQLVPDSFVADCLVCFDKDLPTCKLKIQENNEKFSIQLKAADALIIAADKRGDQLAALVDKLTENGKPKPIPFWETPTFLVSVGFVVGASSAVAIVKLTR